MEAPERGALTLVRLIGVLLILMSLLEVGLYWGECVSERNRTHADAIHLQALPILLRLIPAVIGTAILIKARAIAEWIAEQLDL